MLKKLLFIFPLVISTYSFAQDQTAETDVEEVVTVGSQIKGAKITGALPVTVISAEDIDILGADDGTELLENMAEQGLNYFTEAESDSGGVNSARGDIGAYNIRNMGVGNTLTLLNGRRLVNSAGYQTELVGGDYIPSMTVNSNLIPTMGLDRVELLKDGASAIYGADAVAGVVNNVLQTDFVGFDIAFRSSGYDHFAAQDEKMTLKYGFEMNEGATNVSVLYDLYDRDALPLVLGSDKKRLSKRHAATSLEEYKASGYLDSAILNTLARLGWSKGEKEVFYLDDLIKDFEITEVQKAGAIFDISKLDYLNAQHMANLDYHEFITELEPFLSQKGIDLNSHAKTQDLIESMRTSANSLEAIASNLVCYFKDVEEYDGKAIAKFIGESDEILLDLKDRLSNLNDWDEGSLDKILTKYREEKELSVPKVNQPLRIALTGSTNSPSLGMTLSLFAKEEVLKRIDDLLGFIN